MVDLLRARAVVGRHHLRTPLYFSASLSRELGRKVFIKHENHGPVRSFKARGALFRLSLLRDEERAGGVVTASTGNHGYGVAYAASLLAVPSTIVVPEGTPAIKTDAIRDFGGQLVVHGGDLAHANAAAIKLGQSEGKVCIEDGNDGGLMAGAATIAWEILEDLPDASTVVVPVGGGNLIAAISLVAKLLRPDIRVVGVQSEAAPAVYLSWQHGEIVEAHCRTFAGGLATSFPGSLAFDVIREHVDEMRLVSEHDLRRGIADLFRLTGDVAEGAGAAAFAAARRFRAEWPSGKIVLIFSGGNIPAHELEEILRDEVPP